MISRFSFINEKYKIFIDSSLEATVKESPFDNLKAVDDETAMQIDTINDNFIDANIKVYKMLPVSDPVSIKQGNIPTPNGLYSPYIFGITQEEKHKRYGYINLNCELIHPYVYEILLKLSKAKITKISTGQGSWIIDSNGELIEIEDENDSRFNIENTGITWLVKNIDKINFNSSGSLIRDERIKFINSLSRKDMVITKWIVIPIFYRDIQFINGIMQEPILNSMYKKIISYSSQLDNNIWDSDLSNNTKYKMQLALVEIRKFGQTLIEKKHGFFKKSVIGKSIDYGFRSVISVPNIETFDKAIDCPINILYSGVPLSQCCVLGYPLILREVQEYFRRYLISFGDKLTVLDDKGKPKMVILKNPEAEFNTSYIKKKIDLYINTPAMRFEPITIDTEDGQTVKLVFTARTENNDIIVRPLTWTDILYQSAVEALKNIHVYITRYPLVDYFGTFPSRIFVLSTVKTSPIIINNELFKYYPVIDPSLPQTTISRLFIDTLTMSNMYLKGLGGDYDGDQVTEKFVFSQEANEEAEKLIHSLKHYINIAGNIMRDIGNEVLLTYYNMTKD